MKPINKYRFKITVIGNGSVGKTSLIERYTRGGFKREYVKTIGAQFSEYLKEIKGDQIKLILWDIAGQDDFNFLRPSFYKESRAVIIVYSLEENDLGKRSFEDIPKWHDDIKYFCGDIPVMVFANKVDLINEKSIDRINLEKLVKKRNFLGYCITSAKTGEGVTDAFDRIIQEIHDKSKV
ncbi:MAG: Rab family GTPase [Candidatus Thorarchaeota archaeon]